MVELSFWEVLGRTLLAAGLGAVASAARTATGMTTSEPGATMTIGAEHHPVRYRYALRCAFVRLRSAFARVQSESCTEQPPNQPRSGEVTNSGGRQPQDAMSEWRVRAAGGAAQSVPGDGLAAVTM